MDEIKPYIYLVKNKTTKRFYIGSQCSGKILGKNYFTSSRNKEFKNDFKENTKNYDIWKIIEIEDPSECLMIENQLIKDNFDDPLIINKSYFLNNCIFSGLKYKTKEQREQRNKEIKQYKKQYREEHKEEARQYREEHKKEIATYMKEYSKKENIVNYQKQYRESHKEERKQYDKKRKESTSYKQKNKEYQNKYINNNKEKILKITSLYKQKNKELIKQKNKEYYDKKSKELYKRRKYTKLILRCPILKKIYMNSNQSKKTKIIDYYLERLIEKGAENGRN